MVPKNRGMKRTMHRPYVIVNCAMSADGKIALPSRKQLQISSEEDMHRVYQLRNNCDAILVGIETILTDNPKLTVKTKYVENPRQPIRIVLDTKARTPDSAEVMTAKTRTFIITDAAHSKTKRIEKSNVEIIAEEVDDQGKIKLGSLLEHLHQRGIKKLLVEGGGTIIWSFLKEKLVDELRVYLAPIIIGGKQTPTLADGRGIDKQEEIITLSIVDIQKVGSGLLLTYKPNKIKK